MGEYQSDSKTKIALHVSSPFENDTPFAGSVLEQAATHPGKWQQSLLSLPEAIDLPLLVARDLTQHSPLIAETLSLRHLSQFIGDEQKDILTGNAPDAPLVQPDDATDLISDRTSKQENNNQSEQRKAIKATLAEAITSVKAQLKPFADDPLLTAKLREAFGDQWDIEEAQSLLDQLSSDDHAKFPDMRLKLLPVNQLGAQSAFAASTNTIYVFEDFLSQHLNDPETIATVLLEEIGHYIDAQLNVLDSSGDEGAIFAAIVQNHALSQEDWQALKTENDFALLFDKGKPTIVEQATLYGTAGNDTLVGTTGDDSLYGSFGNDSLSGGAGNDSLDGYDGNDTLNGGDGNDTLNGRTGSDSMNGGKGNDLYYVDSTADKVIERTDVNEGIDTVNSYINFSLDTANTKWVENLSLLGSVATGGTGNVLSNILQGNSLNNLLIGNGGHDTLIGNAGDDTLDGGFGDDSMSGGTGNDTYYVDSYGDRVEENTDEGKDAVFASIDYTLTANLETLILTGNSIRGTGNALKNYLQGNQLDNVLNGGTGYDTLIGDAGNDTLDGGTGDDRMSGDIGNDTYYVDSLYDQVEEKPNSGTDTIISYTSYFDDYFLPEHVENLIIAASERYGVSHTATGNDLDNHIIGNNWDNEIYGREGNDTIDGGSGRNRLYGGTGNDILNGGNGNDDLLGGSGDDILNGGDGRDFLVGDIGDDILNGGDGNDQLGGGVGNDTLHGGNGDDTLAGGGSSGVDQFWGNAGADRFVLYKSNFTPLAVIQDFSTAEGDSITVSGDNILAIQLKDSQFIAGAGVRTATTLSQRVIYDTTTGELFYDADGSGSQFNSIHIATLSNKAVLNATDIYVTPTPAIAIELQQDTGTSNTDRLTANATINDLCSCHCKHS